MTLIHFLLYLPGTIRIYKNLFLNSPRVIRANSKCKVLKPYNLYIISSLFVNIYTFVLILLIFLLLIVLIF